MYSRHHCYDPGCASPDRADVIKHCSPYRCQWNLLILIPNPYQAILAPTLLRLTIWGLAAWSLAVAIVVLILL